MKARAGIGISIVIAFFTALTIAGSPQLHEKLNAPNSPAFLPKHFQFVIASVPSSVQERAPPVAP
jgi:hypothetical protein